MSTLFSGHYLRNRSTLDIGVLGYIGIVYKEHSPEVFHIPLGTPCICMYVCMYACMHVCIYACMHVCIYRVIQEESAILWEMMVCVILSKKVHMNMGPILDGYGVMGIY